MYAIVNGARIYFDVDGEGLTPDGNTMRQKPTVVLVHGGPGADHTVSKPYFNQLTDIAQVVFYDHRANGRSSGDDPEEWNLAQWADDLRGLCDVLGIEHPIVIGTSFGGFVSLAYATRHPDHAAGLVLISTAARVEFQEVYKAFERLGGKEVARIARDYWETPTDDGRALYRDRCVPLYQRNGSSSSDWLSRILWRNETALHFNGPNAEHGRMDFRGDLHRITCPVLLMVGEEDPITPPALLRTSPMKPCRLSETSSKALWKRAELRTTQHGKAHDEAACHHENHRSHRTWRSRQAGMAGRCGSA